MIFRRFHVDGFGIWRDLTLDDLHAGLNVLVAPNEGGKTTLMGFARAVLYGFRQRNHPERYEPLRGGKHGGYLEVSDNDDTYRILRTHDRSSAGALQITDGDGQALPEATLDRLLRGTTRELYENVFAFGLAELQKIETMRSEEVAAHIYSAGMAAAGTDPLGFRARLEDQRRDYFLPRGRKQHIVDRLDQIEALQRDIEPLRQRPEEYARLIEQRTTLRRRLDALDVDLGERLRGLDAARRARSAWGDYEELLAAEAALEAIGVPPAEAAEADATELLTARERAVLRDGGRIRTLHASTARLRELRAAADKHSADAEAAQSALEAHLQDLGPKWTVERILKTDAGLQQREAAREHAAEQRSIAAEIDQISARAGDAHDAYESIVNRPESLSGGAVALVWAVAAVLTFISVFMPLPSRILITGAVAAVGIIAGTVATWLRHRGARQVDAERVAAADRETTLWAQHAVAEEKMGAHTESWRQWLRRQRLDPSLSPDGALDLLDRVREAQEVARQRQSARAGRDRTLEELTVAGGRINALIADLGRSQLDLRGKPLEAVEPLIGELEALQSELDKVEEQHVRLRTQLQQYVQARTALRAGAGEEGLGGLRARLQALDPDKIRRLLADAETGVAAVQAQRDGVNEQLGGIAERIEHLESDAELGVLLLEREQVKAELVAAVTTWAELSATAILFDRAKRLYEEQRQPEVLRLASQYFGTMTGGAYNRVLSPLGENDLQVQEAGGGRRKGPEALSRGTKEQLYLAMRLALAAVYAQQLVALPLVADDILVNFDDERAAAAAALLGEYAEAGVQVLAFTCHQRLAEVFARQAPAANIIHLPKPA